MKFSVVRQHNTEIYCCPTYVLFFNKNIQKNPDKKNISDIMKYNAGKGISPADK